MPINASLGGGRHEPLAANNLCFSILIQVYYLNKKLFKKNFTKFYNIFFKIVIIRKIHFSGHNNFIYSHGTIIFLKKYTELNENKFCPDDRNALMSCSNQYPTSKNCFLAPML